MSNKKEAPNCRLLNKSFTNIINVIPIKSQSMPDTPDMLMEWSLINWGKPEKNRGFIKLYVEQLENSLGLFLLTEQNGLKAEDLIGYEIKATYEQIKQLSTFDALKLYLNLLNASIRELQGKQYKEAC